MTMTRKRSTVLLFVAIGFAQLGYGQGQESLVFELSPDARGAALGSAVMADLDSDVHGAGLNPCLIDTTRQGDVTIDYIDYLVNRYIALACGINETGV